MVGAVTVQPPCEVGEGLALVQLVGVGHAQRQQHVSTGGVSVQGLGHGGDCLLVVVILRMHSAQQAPRFCVLGVGLYLRLQGQARLGQHTAPEQVLALAEGLGVPHEGVVACKHVLALHPAPEHRTKVAVAVYPLPLLERLLIPRIELLHPCVGRLLPGLLQAPRLPIQVQVSHPLGKLIRPVAVCGGGSRSGGRELIGPGLCGPHVLGCKLRCPGGGLRVALNNLVILKQQLALAHLGHKLQELGVAHLGVSVT
mmetsp:Transcript_38367/g.85413  ORF Transcript_38367/g.85413 Transcript_38367/m.85413 type:complete len:255 (-) Transcript_38367:1197-1961(-)